MSPKTQLGCTVVADVIVPYCTSLTTAEIASLSYPMLKIKSWSAEQSFFHKA